MYPDSGYECYRIRGIPPGVSLLPRRGRMAEGHVARPLEKKEGPGRRRGCRSGPCRGGTRRGRRRRGAGRRSGGERRSAGAAAVLVQQAHPVITGPQKAALVAQTRGVGVRWIRGISRGYLCHAVDEPP